MIKINGIIYEADVVEAMDGSMTVSMPTELTLAEIETQFAPTAAPKIEVMDGMETAAVYYNKQLLSIKLSFVPVRTITLQLAVSTLTENAEQKINAKLKANDAALHVIQNLVETVIKRIEKLEFPKNIETKPLTDTNDVSGEMSNV